jgi:hypothetical protein
MSYEGKCISGLGDSQNVVIAGRDEVVWEALAF